MPPVRLPFVKEYSVDARKVVAYLLNPSHAAGGSKAKFFTAFGFVRAEPERMAASLLLHPRTASLVKVSEVSWGVRLHFEGSFTTPSGDTPIVRTVWQIDADNVAWFVTALPLRRRR